MPDNYFLCSKTVLAPFAISHIIFSLTVCLNRQERTQAQQLRDEQDEAYYESVRADQEKVSLLRVEFVLLQCGIRLKPFVTSVKPGWEGMLFVASKLGIPPDSCVPLDSSVKTFYIFRKERNEKKRTEND